MNSEASTADGAAAQVLLGGQPFGQLRDTQHEHDSDAADRLSAENATLRERIRDLTAGQRTLEERLQGARSNNRFLDKRIAGLEAQLLARSREPDAGQPSPSRPPDMPGTPSVHPGGSGGRDTAREIRPSCVTSKRPPDAAGEAETIVLPACES